MIRRLSPIALCVVVALLISTAVAFAHPAGKTTLQETIKPAPGTGFIPLEAGKAEGFKVLRLNARAKNNRRKRRRSIAYFGQLTDPQLADEMSPARLEALDPPRTFGESAHRPQEAFGPWMWDQMVRNMNRQRRSQVRQGNGRRAKMSFVLATGDLADNHQLNETEWYVRIMEGGRVDPFSGKPVSASNPCDAPADEIARLNADVAARNYTGIQDYDDWPADAPEEFKNGFWDPDEAPPSADSMYAAFPRHPGLLDRAQQVFRAEGLKRPWFAIRGNHDGLVGGAIEGDAVFEFIATSCRKVFPNADLPWERYEGDAGRENIARDLGDSGFLAQQLANAQFVPPDPDRRFVAASEYKRLHGSDDRGHGFDFVAKGQRKRSNDAAAYYAMTRRGIRWIGLDTVAEGGGERGNVDHPQYKWLVKELRRAKRRDMLTIVFGHHTLASMDNTSKDEDAGECERADEPDCDLDPRISTPIHRGEKGKGNLRNLFLKHRNVIAYVNGHTHDNAIDAYKRGKRGFWSINTSSVLDWPQQSRLIEVMNNRNGTLSIFATMLNSAAPLQSIANGRTGDVFTDAQIGTLARRISFNDPQRANSPGTRKDRNVELLIRDPR